MKRRNIILVLLALLLVLGIGIVVLKQRQAARLNAQRAAELATRQTFLAVPPPPAPRVSSKQWQDPDAREALKLVGSDAVAEQYWIIAINNPNLPAHERQDLIEDLNEEGYANLKNPTPEDRKLIQNRIKLIEELSPQAMDDVNAAAFKEAHKDLAQMLNRPPR